MQRNRMIVLVIALVLIVIIALLFISRGWLAERLYRAAGNRLDDKLSPKLKEKYGADLHYSLDKFWDFYERGIVDQNDLADVVDKMRRLAERDERKDREIFDFIAYVSRIYTDAMHEYHKKHPYFQPPEPDSAVIDLNQI